MSRQIETIDEFARRIVNRYFRRDNGAISWPAVEALVEPQLPPRVNRRSTKRCGPQPICGDHTPLPCKEEMEA